MEQTPALPTAGINAASDTPGDLAISSPNIKSGLHVKEICSEGGSGQGMPELDGIDHAASHPVISLPDKHHIPVTIIALIAVVFALDLAQSFVISLLVGVLLAYMLNPMVTWLERRLKLHRLIGSTLVMTLLICSLAVSAYSLRGQVQSIIDELPVAANKLSREMVSMHNQRSNMQVVQKAAATVEQATSLVTASGRQAAMHVVIDAPPFQLGDFLWVGSLGVFGFLGQSAMVVFLAYFLLLSGDTFKRKLVRLAGPSMAKRKITVNILDDINHSIQGYMFMLLITNALVGVLSWAVFQVIGLNNAGAWGAAAGFLHIIPYFGSALIIAITGLAAFMQFNSLGMAVLVAGACVAISTLVGVFITTWMMGRIAKMNTAAVFISLLFWTWLWGIWGILLSVPIIVIVKVIAQHVEQLHALAELLTE